MAFNFGASTGAAAAFAIVNHPPAFAGFGSVPSSSSAGLFGSAAAAPAAGVFGNIGGRAEAAAAVAWPVKPETAFFGGSIWKCVTQNGVAYRNSTSFHDRYRDTRGPDKDAIVHAEQVGPYDSWLKVELGSHGTKYLPIVKHGGMCSEVFFERVRSPGQRTGVNNEFQQSAGPSVMSTFSASSASGLSSTTFQVAACSASYGQTQSLPPLPPQNPSEAACSLFGSGTSQSTFNFGQAFAAGSSGVPAAASSTAQAAAFHASAPSRDPSLESLEHNCSHQPQQQPLQLEQQLNIVPQHQTPILLPSRAIEKVSLRHHTSKLHGGH